LEIGNYEYWSRKKRRQKSQITAGFKAASFDYFCNQLIDANNPETAEENKICQNLRLAVLPDA